MMNTPPIPPLHGRPRVITVANQKGGVGKTTTAINLGTALAAIGERVAILDLDSQGNASTGLGIAGKDRSVTSYEVMAGEAGLDDAMMPTVVPGLSIVPSTVDLSSLEMEISSDPQRALRLRAALNRYQGAQASLPADQRLSYILVDCPPSLSLLTVNAMTASHAVLVPLQCEFFALEGLSQLLRTVEQVRGALNPALIIHGIALTMFDARNNLSSQVVEDVRKVMGDKVYATMIPRNVRLSEAPSYGRPAILYDFKCAGSQAYIKLAQEVIERERQLRLAAAIDRVAQREGMAMADDASKRRLGRGLAALMGDAVPESVAVDQVRQTRRLPIEQIAPNPQNPRGTFSEEALDELTASIREKGVVQPLLVRTLDEGRYELIAGERRWRAAQRAGLDAVPVVVRDVSDQESLELAIIENVQRADLNPLEEALGYQRLIESFAYTQQDLATVIGKSRSHIANTLRLLKLPEGIQGYVSSGALSAGHARQLIGRDDAPELARRILDDGLSVRDIERLVQARDAGEADAAPVAKADPGKVDRDADTRAIEAKLSDLLGLNVTLKPKSDGSGALTIRYTTLEQLDDLLRRIGA